MSEQEGIIKFQMAFTDAPPVADEWIRELNAWRQTLVQCKGIGQDPGRYDGYGYGNISQRIPPFDAPRYNRPFLISGTQTGGLPILDTSHYATVLACYPHENRIIAEGPVRPSSESMTHGVLYALDAHLRFVMHIHAPEIWHRAEALILPTTRPSVRYGSPEMAEEVDRLFRESDVRARRIFVMGGHEDGVVSFGRTAREAASPLLALLKPHSPLFNS